MLMESLLAKVFVGVTTVSLLGLGGMVLRHESQLAVENVQYKEIIRRLDKIEVKLDSTETGPRIIQVLEEIKTEQKDLREDVGRIQNYLSPRRGR